MKELALTGGKIIILDDEDFELYSRWKWQLSNKGYAQRSKRINGVMTTLLLHRLIMNAGRKQHIDHKNHQPLDNRKANLRICNHTENMHNHKIHKNNKSGYIGVSLDMASGKYRAFIKHEGKSIALGSFDTKEKAAQAYKAHAAKLFGEFANS